MKRAWPRRRAASPGAPFGGNPSARRSAGQAGPSAGSIIGSVRSAAEREPGDARGLDEESTLGAGTGARVFRERAATCERATLETGAGVAVRALRGDSRGSPLDARCSPGPIVLAEKGAQ